MNVEEIARAMLDMARNHEMRTQMGEVGYKRLMLKYQIGDMRKTYEKIYHDFSDVMKLEWTNEPFRISYEDEA